MGMFTFTVSNHAQRGDASEARLHPNVSEWQYWIRGKGRMTVVTSGAKARTMAFNPNDVGYVPTMAGQRIENTGTEDLVFLEMFKTSRYSDISLNESELAEARSVAVNVRVASVFWVPKKSEWFHESAVSTRGGPRFLGPQTKGYRG
jgi:oxalate decarboxylase/phosphoglucose isomerase-like protein (cupin superfamily)